MEILGLDATQRMIDQIKVDEGVSSKLYTCTAGKATIGVGRNLDDMGLRDDEIDYLLMNDLMRVEEELVRTLPVILELSENRKMVLINMAFNLGITRLLNFKKMIEALQNEDYQEAAEQMMDSRWAEQVGKRAERLSELMVIG